MLIALLDAAGQRPHLPPRAETPLSHHLYLVRIQDGQTENVFMW